MKRTLHLALLCTVGLNIGCATVPVAHSFADVRRSVSKGDVLDVRGESGASQRGTLVDLSPRSLILMGDGRVEMAEHEVTQIRREQTQRGRGALVGLGAGVVIGILASRQSAPSGCTICDAQGAGVNVLFTMGVGAGVGAIVGGIVKSHRVVYERSVVPTP